MRIYEVKNYEELSRKAADMIAAQIILKPDCVLGLATGSTPVGACRELIKKYENGELDFSQVSSVNLDEYKGLSGENDQSYRYFMNHNLFDHINIDKTRTHVPNGLEPDADKACADYNTLIGSMGGIDLQLLGIGGNGHIGFNEPCEEFICDTHCVSLAQSTIEANARFFDSIDEVPKFAYTMGIRNIMSDYPDHNYPDHLKTVLLSRDKVSRKAKAPPRRAGSVMSCPAGRLLQLQPFKKNVSSQQLTCTPVSYFLSSMITRTS